MGFTVRSPAPEDCGLHLFVPLRNHGGCAPRQASLGPFASGGKGRAGTSGWARTDRAAVRGVATRLRGTPTAGILRPAGHTLGSPRAARTPRPHTPRSPAPPPAPPRPAPAPPAPAAQPAALSPRGAAVSSRVRRGVQRGGVRAAAPRAPHPDPAPCTARPAAWAAPPERRSRPASPASARRWRWRRRRPAPRGCGSCCCCRCSAKVSPGARGAGGAHSRRPDTCAAPGSAGPRRRGSRRSSREAVLPPWSWSPNLWFPGRVGRAPRRAPLSGPGRGRAGGEGAGRRVARGSVMRCGPAGRHFRETGPGASPPPCPESLPSQTGRTSFREREGPPVRAPHKRTSLRTPGKKGGFLSGPALPTAWQGASQGRSEEAQAKPRPVGRGNGDSGFGTRPGAAQAGTQQAGHRAEAGQSPHL